jgi:hypothetical protein
MTTPEYPQLYLPPDLRCPSWICIYDIDRLDLYLGINLVWKFYLNILLFRPIPQLLYARPTPHPWIVSNGHPITWRVSGKTKRKTDTELLAREGVQVISFTYHGGYFY